MYQGSRFQFSDQPLEPLQRGVEKLSCLFFRRGSLCSTQHHAPFRSKSLSRNRGCLSYDIRVRTATNLFSINEITACSAQCIVENLNRQGRLAAADATPRLHVLGLCTVAEP